MALLMFPSDRLSTWDVFPMNEEADLDPGASSPWQDIPESLKMRAKMCSASSAETQDCKVHCH